MGRENVSWPCGRGKARESRRQMTLRESGGTGGGGGGGGECREGRGGRGGRAGGMGGMGRRAGRRHAGMRVRFRPEIVSQQCNGCERCTRISREVHPRKLRQNLDALTRSPREDDRQLAARLRQADRERRADERARQRARERAEREWRLQMRRGLLPPGVPPPGMPPPYWLQSFVAPSAVTVAEGPGIGAAPSGYSYSSDSEGEQPPRLVPGRWLSESLVLAGAAASERNARRRAPPWMTFSATDTSADAAGRAASAPPPTTVPDTPSPAPATAPGLSPVPGPSSAPSDNALGCETTEKQMGKRRSTQVFFSPWVRECGDEDDIEELYAKKGEEKDGAKSHAASVVIKADESLGDGDGGNGGGGSHHEESAQKRTRLHRR